MINYLSPTHPWSLLQSDGNVRVRVRVLRVFLRCLPPLHYILRQPFTLTLELNDLASAPGQWAPGIPFSGITNAYYSAWLPPLHAYVCIYIILMHIFLPSLSFLQILSHTLLAFFQIHDLPVLLIITAYMCLYLHMHIYGIYVCTYIFLNIPCSVHPMLPSRDVCSQGWPSDSGQPIGVFFPGENSLTHFQLSSVAYWSSCKIEVSWAFPHPVRHIHCCHPCSAYI